MSAQELPDNVLWPALQAAYAELGREKAIQAFRRALSAYAPPQVARLKGVVEREHDEARQELATLRAHTDKLEAMLTVAGEKGPVKLWQPFEVNLKKDQGWRLCEFRPGYEFIREYLVGSDSYSGFFWPKPRRCPPVRQLKSGEVLARWRYPLAPCNTVFVTTDEPCSINDLPETVRDLAVEVIGEAE